MSLAQRFLGGLAATAVASVALAQTTPGARPPGATPRSLASASPHASAAPSAPPTIEGYVATVEIKATAPEMKAPAGAAPEAQAVVGSIRSSSSLVSKVYLAQDLSRQEIVSTDFVLPAGTIVMHKAGDRYYVIADPKAKTYAVMDSDALLNAFEGGAGILNSQYEATVEHTDEKKTMAGFPARKSILTVKYVSSIPLENDRILVQQKNDVEIWHTSALASAAAMEHFFFKYQRDKTGAVRKAVATEIGFPLDVKVVVTQGSGKKGTTPQPGSLDLTVTEIRKDPKLDSELFRIPPANYRRIDRLPFFAPGMQAKPSGGQQ